MSVAADIPFVAGPMVNPDGTPTQAWWAFFRQLWVRTGSGAGISAEDLELLSLLQGRPSPEPDLAAQFAPLRPFSRPVDLSDANLFALMLFGSVRNSIAAVVASVAVTANITATEALTANSLVNVYSGGVRKADASATGKEAGGWVAANVANGATAAVLFGGKIGGLSGLTKGRAFLDPATPGGVTSTPPTTSGQTLQQVGIAVSATEIIFAPFASIDL